MEHTFVRTQEARQELKVAGQAAVAGQAVVAGRAVDELGEPRPKVVGKLGETGQTCSPGFAVS
ncbi:MAG: hypothetical protein MOB07_21980 [Acidobacteria bacterium]|nr:hypothetical protein [Acidobacteriota bacterium]